MKRTAATALAVLLTIAGCSRSDDLGIQASASSTAQDTRNERVTAVAPTSFYGTAFERRPDPTELTSLGRRLFFDPSLSSSGRMACSSCHDPAQAFSPSNDLSVQKGGPDLTQAGLRAVPSIKYQQSTPPFTEHFQEADGDDSVDQGPTGGRNWDGSADSAHDQSKVPLLSPFEMANADSDAVVLRLSQSPSAPLFEAAFGPHIFDNNEKAWVSLLWALEAFQQSPEDFYPYSSKYDAFLRGQAKLDAAEQRGLKLFNDEAKGNCAQCHPSAIKRGSFPQFTDYGLIAIGVPRNKAIPANSDPFYQDLGLCGPQRTDFRDKAEYCGLFKTPSLRNVALKKRFFHNGVFRRLDDVVAFYAQRDLSPGRFYPRDARLQVVKFDDLPPAYHTNVNTDPPFGRVPGQRPALTTREITDVVAFLKTLTDGYRLQK